MTSHIFKLFQRKLYDILSNKYYLLVLLIVSGCLISSLFLFGEAVVDWANHKYVHYIRLFEDNLSQSHLEKDLCAQLPIDVVYTWVNGSDPKLLTSLQHLQENNRQRFSTCRFINCVSLSRVIVIPALSSGQKSQFILKFNHSASIANLTDVFRQSPDTGPNNATVVQLNEGSKKVNVSRVVLDESTFLIYPLHVTSESILHGFVSPFDSYIIDKQQEKSSLNKAVLIGSYLERSNIIADKIIETDSAVLLTLSSNMKLQLDNLDPNSTKSSYSVKRAYLVWDFNQDDSLSGDFAPSRFQDNEELRYSLRSVERYAPWVHHIYLVTNGQVPSWLNLANPRITVVPHTQIFPNRSHLPTFSSPAIESHIHRIPGLSRHFLYFNDDVFLGKPITPADFYTQSGGYKVYLSWSVPNCREDCPSNWLKDGYCDKACNYSECAWDEGDCLRSGGQVGYALSRGSNNLLFGAAQPGGGLPPLQGMWNRVFLPPPMCSPGCGDNWLGDRYCDMACNTLDCGFDIGDCGDTDLDKLFTIRAVSNNSVCHIPPGVSVVVIDLKRTFGLQGEIERGEFQETPSIRLISLAQKYKTLFLMLRNVTQNSTPVNIAQEPSFNVSIDLSGKSGAGTAFNMSLFVIFNSREKNIPVGDNSVDFSTTESPELIPPVFTGYPRVSKQPYPAYDNISHAEGKSIQFGVTARPPTLKDRRLLGFLPWEKQGVYIQSHTEETVTFHSRHLLASYADSLKFTNRRLSHVYGHSQRKVPGHMPHFIDRNILEEAQKKFSDDWSDTSSHRVRSPEDVQFSLTYYYYLMSESVNETAANLISDLDINKNGILEAGELYVMAVRMMNSPLSQSDKNYFNQLVANCSLQGIDFQTRNDIISTEVSGAALSNCEEFVKEVNKRYPPVSKYKFETLGEDEIWFKMISANVSRMKHHLEEIVRSPRKFLCINDNLNHFDTESSSVKQMLATFLQTLYPIPSQFELPQGVTNSHLYWEDYINDARIKKMQILLIGLSIIVLFILMCCAFPVRLRLCRRWPFCKRRCGRLKQSISA